MSEGGSGKMPDLAFAKGTEWTVVDCEFTPPEGYKFTKWHDMD